MIRSDEDGGTFSYGAADAVVAALGLRLAAAGIRKGDRVALVSPFHPEAALLCWAAMGLGAVVVPLDPDRSSVETAASMAQIEPALLFDGAGQAGLAVRFGISAIRFDETGEGPGTPFAEWLREPAGGVEPQAAPEPGDPAAILFTSGTSAGAKGVVLSHAALCRSGALMAASYGWRPEDVLLSLGEIHTVSGLRNPCLAALYAGCSFVSAAPQVRSNGLLLSACIARHRVTLLSCVPAMLMQLARFSQRIEREAMASLRLVLCTGSRLPDACKNSFEEAFGVPVVNYYGLTETAGLCAGTPPSGAARRPGNIGVPLGCRIAVLDEEGQPVTDGGVGELRVGSDQLMSGYWREPELTDRVLRDGWFRTGDLVSVEPDGSLVLLDRRGEAFKDHRGAFVQPSEIEQALESHPRVGEAGICWGRLQDGEEAIIGFIVPAEPSLDWTGLEAELRGFVAERLGVHRTPARILRVASLPRGTNGKLLRRRLKELCLEQG